MYNGYVVILELKSFTEEKNPLVATKSKGSFKFVAVLFLLTKSTLGAPVGFNKVFKQLFHLE